MNKYFSKNSAARLFLSSIGIFLMWRLWWTTNSILWARPYDFCLFVSVLFLVAFRTTVSACTLRDIRSRTLLMQSMCLYHSALVNTSCYHETWKKHVSYMRSIVCIVIICDMAIAIAALIFHVAHSIRRCTKSPFNRLFCYSISMQCYFQCISSTWMCF